MRAAPLSLQETAGFLATMNDGARQNPVIRAVKWLSVENSARYLPEGKSTFCNVYAHDLSRLLGIYLPRIWWTENAGIPVLGKSVREVTSNDISHWLIGHGSRFGWRRLLDADDAQKCANGGQLVLVSGEDTCGGHGHISVVVPESNRLHAIRVGGHVVSPVQSHAGRTNVGVGLLGPWWTKFERHSFWAAHPTLRTTTLKPVSRREGFFGRVLPFAASWFLGETVRFLDAMVEDLTRAEPYEPTLSSTFLRALIAGEDRRFFTHEGFDLIAIARAVVRRLQNGSIQGASTIEQQLVRTLTQRKKRTAWRKISEIMLAAHLASRLQKEMTASIYLRVAYYGWRMNGVTQACRRLGIDPAHPSVEQACDLVAALRYPLPRSVSPQRRLIWLRRSRYISRVLGELSGKSLA